MIKIDDIIPLLKKGYVAMDKNNSWWWYESKPFNDNYLCSWIACERTSIRQVELDMFDIDPVEDWTKSLMEVGK